MPVRAFFAVALAFMVLSPSGLSMARDKAPPPHVLVSIAPLAGIAAAVMEGVATPDVLVKGNVSPHTYQLRPADAARLEQADIILWAGEGLETFLPRALSALAGDSEIIELAEEPSLAHLPVRKSGVWEEHDHGHDAHDHEHDHAGSDPHLWLDPDNAVAIARLLADRLAVHDSANAAIYRENAARFARTVENLDMEMKEALAPLQDRGFIVFHDAYQYFERHYGLNGQGAVTLSPDMPPSAAQVAGLQKRIREMKVVCVLAEPQFRAAVVDSLIKGTAAVRGTVNPDASDLPVGPGLYPEFMRRLQQEFSRCLAGG